MSFEGRGQVSLQSLGDPQVVHGRRGGIDAARHESVAHPLRAAVSSAIPRGSGSRSRLSAARKPRWRASVARCAGLALALSIGAATWIAHPSSALAGGGVSPITASAQDRKRAQAKYEEGTRLYEAHRYADAQKAFQESYDIVASPNSHLMMARSMREQNQIVSAYEEFERVENEARQLAAADAAKYSGTVDKAIIDREALRKRIGLVTVRVRGEESLTVTVAGRVVAGERLARPVPVVPGRVEVVGTADDGRRAARFVNVGAGASQDVDIDLSAEPVAALAPPTGPDAPVPPAATEPDSGGERRTSMVPFAVISGGLAVVALGVGIGFGVAQDSIFDRITDCDSVPGECVRTSDWTQNEENRGKSWQTIANVSFVAAGGLGAVTAALLAVEALRTPSGESSTGKVRMPQVAVGPGGVSVSGAF